MVKELISVYLDEILKQKGLAQDQLQNNIGEEDDEEENFDANQYTKKQDNLDWFSLLMKKVLQYSMKLIHDRLCSAIQQYEILLAQH